MRLASHHTSFSLHPLALLAAALAAGILIAHFVPSSLVLLSVCAALTSVLAIASLLKQRLAAASLLVMLATLIGGATLETIGSRSVRTDQIKQLLDEGVIVAGDPVEITGVL